MKKTIQLELSIEEVNMIISSLSKEPFIDVYKLIEKIHLQSKEDRGTDNTEA